MRVVENKELPTFAEGIRSGEGGLSKPHESGEYTLIKPEVVKPAAPPEFSFSLFASPEAQKALKFINGEESEEEENKDENDKSKNENNNENTEDEDQGIMSRYKWRVVAKTVADCPRAPIKPDVSKKSTSPCRSIKTSEEVAPRMCRRASLAPDQRDQRCLSPVPPKGARSRRMSLSPSRHPLLPSRPISPVPPANINKTSSESNLQETNSSSSQELKSSPPKIDVTGGNPAIARALSRRRFSLPVTPSSQLLPPHPPSPLSPRRRFPVDRNSPSNSTDVSSPTSIKNTINQRTSVTSTLQANRQKLEALMKERSRAIANLTIGGSRESIPSPSSSVKSKPDSPMMSPAPIRANHSLPRPILSRRSSITSETESDASQAETIETISLLDSDAARLDAMVADVIEMQSPPNSDVMSVKSESADSPRSLTASPLRMVGGRPVFKRRGSCSMDSGISLSDTASVGSEQEATPSTTNQTDDEIPRMSRLRNRRGTICMGSLSAFVAQTSRESDARSSSSSPHPVHNTNSNQRSKDDIEEEVEEELQKRIMQRKSQLLMQAAPGSSNMASAVSRLQERAICKTTNGRLKKIMGNLTLERTTSELLSMKAALNAAAKRREVDGIKKSKSLDCD